MSLFPNPIELSLVIVVALLWLQFDLPTDLADMRRIGLWPFHRE